MITAPDALHLACDALMASALALNAATTRLRDQTTQMLARDTAACPPPVRCVLVVHDDDAVRMALVHALADLGVPIVEASTCAEARLALRRGCPKAIVADYHLGDEASACLLRDRPACSRATIVTGRVDLDALAPIAAGCGARVVATPASAEEMDALVTIVRADLDAA